MIMVVLGGFYKWLGARPDREPPDEIDSRRVNRTLSPINPNP